MERERFKLSFNVYFNTSSNAAGVNLTLQLMEVVHLTAISVTFPLGSLFLKNGMELG